MRVTGAAYTMGVWTFVPAGMGGYQHLLPGEAVRADYAFGLVDGLVGLQCAMTTKLPLKRSAVFSNMVSGFVNMEAVEARPTDMLEVCDEMITIGAFKGCMPQLTWVPKGAALGLCCREGQEMLWTAPCNLWVKSAANWQYHIYPPDGCKLVSVFVKSPVLNDNPDPLFVEGSWRKTTANGLPTWLVMHRAAVLEPTIKLFVDGPKLSRLGVHGDHFVAEDATSRQWYTFGKRQGKSLPAFALYHKDSPPLYCLTAGGVMIDGEQVAGLDDYIFTSAKADHKGVVYLLDSTHTLHKLTAKNTLELKANNVLDFWIAEGQVVVVDMEGKSSYMGWAATGTVVGCANAGPAAVVHELVVARNKCTLFWEGKPIGVLQDARLVPSADPNNVFVQQHQTILALNVDGAHSCHLITGTLIALRSAAMLGPRFVGLTERGLPTGSLAADGAAYKHLNPLVRAALQSKHAIMSAVAEGMAVVKRPASCDVFYTKKYAGVLASLKKALPKRTKETRCENEEKVFTGVCDAEPSEVHKRAQPALLQIAHRSDHLMPIHHAQRPTCQVPSFLLVQLQRAIQKVSKRTPLIKQSQPDLDKRPQVSKVASKEPQRSRLRASRASRVRSAASFAGPSSN